LQSVFLVKDYIRTAIAPNNPMERRKSLKIIGTSAVGIAGLVLADWKWQIVDELTHRGFFNRKEEKLISAIADTIIPAGLPPKLPTPDAQPIGALSTGTDKFLIKFFEHCSEKEEQDFIKAQLALLDKKEFLKATKEDREAMFLTLDASANEDEVKFFSLMKSQTIFGFTTVKEVMAGYRGYKVAPGYYHGCVDVSAKA
jgi:hypothetical protein